MMRTTAVLSTLFVVTALTSINCTPEFTTCGVDLACGGGSSEESTSSKATGTSSTGSVGGGNHGGGGGMETSSSTSGTGGQGGGCAADEKVCGENCVKRDDPLYGCADDQCNPCPTSHNTAMCQSGACAIDMCDPGYGDCDTDPMTGCEADLMASAVNCGACDVPCSGDSLQCDTGICQTPCGPLPNSTSDYLCWVYGNPMTVGANHIGLRGGINQDVDPFNNSASCINPNAGDPFVLCDLGTPVPTDTILALAGQHAMATQFSGSIAGTFDCSVDICGGAAYGYKQGVECGQMMTGSASGCLSVMSDPNFGGTKVVSFAP